MRFRLPFKLSDVNARAMPSRTLVAKLDTDKPKNGPTPMTANGRLSTRGVGPHLKTIQRSKSWNGWNDTGLKLH